MSRTKLYPDPDLEILKPFPLPYSPLGKAPLLFPLFGKEGSPKNRRFFGVLVGVRGDFKKKKHLLLQIPPYPPFSKGG